MTSATLLFLLLLLAAVFVPLTESLVTPPGSNSLSKQRMAVPVYSQSNSAEEKDSPPPKNSFLVDSSSSSSPFNAGGSGEINGYSMPSGLKIAGYSTFLEKKQPWKNLSREEEQEMDEDGYANLQRTKRSFAKQVLKLPLQVMRKAWKVALPSTRDPNVSLPGTLILVRHGESEWNRNKTFTGWADPDLTEQGKREMEHAARLLMEGGYKIDVVFTSRLKRAIRSVWILLQEFNMVYLPVFKSWRLNERMVRRE